MAILTTNSTTERLTATARKRLGSDHSVVQSDSDSWGKYLLLRNGKAVAGLGWSRREAKAMLDDYSREMKAEATQ